MSKFIESLYLNPIRNLLSLNFDKQALQLLIDIKTAPYETIDRLVLILKKYPEITSNPLVSIVISGSQPKIVDYPNYPNYIKFDYQKLIKITDQNILDKVGLISLSLRKFSNWNGLSDLSFADMNINGVKLSKKNKYKVKARNTVEAIKKAAKMAGLKGGDWLGTHTHSLKKIG